ncbi:MAG: TetR/AcrR family transcriptional regulator [Deltaproteobacteria bacterium]|nr:TetR/AcrR family transcriptional regulator [Deltaproteobacteria bacterium]
MARRREDRLSPRKRPRQRRSQETVAVILEAAARLFETHGYHAASTNRIAECAGVSVGSLYEYFPSKESLLAALVDQHLEQGRTLLGTLATGTDDGGALPPLAILTRRFVDAMIALHAASPALHRVLFEETRLHPRLRQAMIALEDDMTTATEAILRLHPEVRVPDVAVAARIVVQVIESLTHNIVIHPRPGALPSEYAETITRLVTGYLRDDRTDVSSSGTPLKVFGG